MRLHQLKKAFVSLVATVLERLPRPPPSYIVRKGADVLNGVRVDGLGKAEPPARPAKVLEGGSVTEERVLALALDPTGGEIGFHEAVDVSHLSPPLLRYHRLKVDEGKVLNR